MKKILVLCILIDLFTLVGCTNKINLDLMIFVDSIGIDYDKDLGDYYIYYHIASSDTLLTSELGSSSSQSYYSIAKVQAKSIYEGIDMIKCTSIKNIILTHIQSIIVTTNFINANNNLIELNNIVKTYKEISPNFFIFATDIDLESIYSVKNPDNISSFFSIITSNNYIKSYKLTYYTELAQSLGEETLITKIPLIRASDSIWKKDKEKLTSLFIAGNIYIDKDGNNILIEKDKFQVIELLNHINETSLVINDNIYTFYKFKNRIKEKNNEFTFFIKANIITSSELEDINETKRTISNYLSNEINNIIIYGLNNNIDIFNLSDIIYRKTNKKRRLEYQDISIKFHFNITIST